MISPFSAAAPFAAPVRDVRVRRMGMHYQPFPNTHWSLVRRAAGGDGHHEALAILLARYEPALRSYLRFVRRMPADATDDLLHSFIADKVLEDELLRHADENRGRFRSFLLTSLNNFAISRHRADHKTAGLAATPEAAVTGTPDARFETEWARALLHNVIAAMREECERTGRNDVWTVFENRVLAETIQQREPLPYGVLAEQLKLSSPTQAANLLVTAKRMYARLLRAAVAEYERDPDAIDEEIAELHEILSRPSAE